MWLGCEACGITAVEGEGGKVGDRMKSKGGGHGDGSGDYYCSMTLQ